MVRKNEHGSYSSRDELMQKIFPREYERRQETETSPEQVGEMFAARLIKQARQQLRKASR